MIHSVHPSQFSLIRPSKSTLTLSTTMENYSDSLRNQYLTPALTGNRHGKRISVDDLFLNSRRPGVQAQPSDPDQEEHSSARSRRVTAAASAATGNSRDRRAQSRSLTGKHSGLGNIPLQAVPNRANGTQRQIQLLSAEFMDGLGQHFATLRSNKVLTGQAVHSNLHQSNLSKGGMIPGAASVRGTRPDGEYKPPNIQHLYRCLYLNANMLRFFRYRLQPC